MDYKSQNVSCQNCKKDFTIDPEDFGFYEKIKVPAPTWCPECRSVRRMASTNERTLYWRKCDLTGKKILSMYPEDAPFPVYHPKDWYGDGWDAYEYGVDYDFNKSFFEQFLELRGRVPKMALVRQGESVNSEYTHRVNNMKNSFMVFRATDSEDSMYVYIAKSIVNCVDCFALSKCELCYECVDCNNCYKVRFSQESSDCRDSFFLKNCRNLSDCVGCVNLVNGQYYIFNKKYTREEYFEKLKSLALNTASGIKKAEEEFNKFKRNFPQRFAMSLKSEDVSGNWFENCKNVKNSFWCFDVKDGKYLYFIFGSEDCMDFFQWGNGSELIYESENCGINSSRIFFSSQCWMGAQDLYYCDSCPGAKNCFGCIGLKKGEYSILNKKYTKENYEKLLPKIIQHMKDSPYKDKKGIVYRFGEHFPEELSPFAYNETAALDFYPLSKESILFKGYNFKEREKTNYKITISSKDLPDTISEVSDGILHEVISCEEGESDYSTGAFKINQEELNFYRKMDLPLPRACFNIRHKRRLERRPPLSISKRNCTKCGLEVETVYGEKNYPVLYCEKCYQQEVY